MDYVTRVFQDLRDIPSQAWDGLCALQDAPTPFMSYAYLLALHTSRSASPQTGWKPQYVTLWQDDRLVAACPLYLKSHSYGEYVFDWAWANAYAEHGLSYYPKGLVAVPFTPVPGSRLLALDDRGRTLLLQNVLEVCKEKGLSSLHLLFTSPQDRVACNALGLMQRQTVQFHWRNEGDENFEQYLARMNHTKRKKIKQERRRVHEAGITFRWIEGAAITAEDWAFFAAAEN